VWWYCCWKYQCSLADQPSALYKTTPLRSARQSLHGSLSGRATIIFAEENVASIGQGGKFVAGAADHQKRAARKTSQGPLREGMTILRSSSNSPKPRSLAGFASIIIPSPPGSGDSLTKELSIMSSCTFNICLAARRDCHLCHFRNAHFPLTDNRSARKTGRSQPVGVDV
jgi:hypothetical protein